MALLKKHISLYGGSSWRPLISVQDVSNAFFKVLKAKNQKVKNEIFNVGGHNENYKIIDIVHLIKKNIT